MCYYALPCVVLFIGQFLVASLCWYILNTGMMNASLQQVVLCMQAIASGSESSAGCIASVRSAADMVAAGAAVPSSVERLVALSALKHEDRAGDIAAVGSAALKGGGSAAGLASVAVEFGGLKRREEELFGGGLLGNVRRMMGGSEDMSAYMQHTPLLKQQLELAADGKLDSKKYPAGTCAVSASVMWMCLLVGTIYDPVCTSLMAFFSCISAISSACGMLPQFVIFV